MISTTSMILLFEIKILEKDVIINDDNDNNDDNNAVLS